MGGGARADVGRREERCVERFRLRCGRDDGVILRSSDGIDWSHASDGTADTPLMDVVWSGARFVAVGAGGAILYSGDGERWERSGRMTWDLLGSIAWSSERYVALGRGGAVLRSRDGVAWEFAEDSSETMPDLNAIASGDGRLVAVGNNTILHGRDGDAWEIAGVDGVSGQFLGVAWGGDRFVSVGGSGTVHSRDGIHWKEGARSVVVAPSVRGCVERGPVCGGRVGRCDHTKQRRQSLGGGNRRRDVVADDPV